jgi:hypothetical protein
VSPIMQVKGKVIKDSTLTMEVKEGLVGLQNSSKAKKMWCRCLGRPLMRAITLGSHGVMVVRSGSPGLHQSSAIVTNPKRSVREEERWGCLDLPP